MAWTAASQGRLIGFVTAAFRPLLSPRMLVPALVLTILLTASNAVILLIRPPSGQLPSLPFILAAIVRIGGLLLVAVAMLRLLTGSARPAWRPDPAFWLYAATLLFVVLVNVAVGALIGGGANRGLVLRSILVTLAAAPFAVWFTAIAVERPLAWRPAPHFRRFGRWLPHLLFWGLLLTTPMGILHAWLDRRLLEGAGDWFWPLVLIDGPLSALLAIVGFALAAEAYRRVARG